MAKNTGLGKGLGELSQSKNINISNFTAAKGQGIGAIIPSKKSSSVGEIINVELSKISVNPFQPRKKFDKIKLNELKDSIIKYGLLNPINVKEIIGGYELVAGERRFRAFQLAGLESIPAIITSVNSNVEQLEKALIENIQREDLNPIEIANSYQQLIEKFGYTQEQLAERVGKERPTITNLLRILKLPIPVQDLILQNKITTGHAKILLSLDDKTQIINIANDIVNKELSVRATETIVRNFLSEKISLSNDGRKKIISPKTSSLTTDEQIFIGDIQNRLRILYGTNIKIYTKADKKGTIEFEFYSLDDFERIVELLEQNKIE